MVPATGVFWSTIWSTVARGEWKAAYGGIVYEPDLRLRFGNRQVDGFGFAGG